MELQEILGLPPNEAIEQLKQKTVIVPPWNDLVKEYDPQKHDIMTDMVTRRDKKRKNGLEKASRISFGLQRLAAKRMTQMAFSIPVKRIYNSLDGVRQEQADAMEAIYDKVRIDAINKKRFKAYFSCCEMATIWYAYDKKNTDYGFPAKTKLRCVSYSPMESEYSQIEQADIYPLFNDFGDLIALSFEFVNSIGKDSTTTFVTYTADKIIKWQRTTAEYNEVGITPNVLGKIQGIYICRPTPIWEDATITVKEIEYTLSRHSDIIRRNSAPILKVTGELINAKEKMASTEAREVYQLKEGGELEYANSPIAFEAVEGFIRTLRDNMEEELQLPNLTTKNISNVGLSGEARKHLLTDAHLKVGEEAGDIIEFLNREFNVIREMLKSMRPDWKSSIDELTVEHDITPFTMSDETDTVSVLSKTTGGRPFVSQRTAIKRLGWVDDADEELQQIQEEEEQGKATDLFEPTE